MAISRKLLNDDESVVVSTRTHVKALIVPAVVLIVLAGGAGFASTFAPAEGAARLVVLGLIWGVAALLALLWVVRPFLAWLTTTYTVTDQRLITRSGILTRRGHDIPITRISDVAYERGLLDRMLGCGTLLVAVASEQRVELHDIPQVEQVHLRIQDLLSDAPAPRQNDLQDDPGARRTDG
ncbi:PH domain-containing protein [Nocardioides pakistanensis]